MRRAAYDPSGLDGERATRFAVLARAVAAADPLVQLGLNANRRLLVSLRYHRSGGVLTIHHGLLDEAPALADLPRWVRSRGRGSFPGMLAGMRAVSDRLRLHEDRARGTVPLPTAESVGGPIDLQAWLDRIHTRWFAHLPKPRIGWGRASARRQRHIRFGCYRSHPDPLITLHPRLDQPWIARIFVEHVIFHELCHHAQACRPVRGERAHSERFRAWERRFPDHAAALEWERAVLHHLLDGTVPTGAASMTG